MNGRPFKRNGKPPSSGRFSSNKSSRERTPRGSFRGRGKDSDFERKPFDDKRSFSRRKDEGGFDKPYAGKSTRKSFDGDRGNPSYRGEGTPRGSFRSRGKDSDFERKPFDDKRSFSRRKDEGGFDKPYARKSTRKSFDGDRDKPSYREGTPRSSFRSRGKDSDFERKPFDDKRSFSRRKDEGDSDKPYARKSTRENFDKEEANERKRLYRKDENYGKPYRKTYGKKTTSREFGDEERRSPRAEGWQPFDRARDVKKRGAGFDETQTPKKTARAKARTSSKAAEKIDDGLIRLNKFLANSGAGSRRQADEYIAMGLVTVNGEVVTAMGHKVKPDDEVRYEGKRMKMEKPVYVLINKPKNCITTTDDPQERNTVMNLTEGCCKERIYPVGRLDRNTTGLLLLTNDGELADKLTHPSHEVKKIYKAELNKPLANADFEKIAAGIYLEEGKAIVDDLAIVSDDRKTVGLEIHIGWNRVVRRIFERMDYEVVKLDRVMYAGLDKKNLGRGEWRMLTQEEISRLKRIK